MKAILSIILLPFKILAFVLGAGWRVVSAIVNLCLRMFRFVVSHSIGATIGAVIGYIIGRKMLEHGQDNSAGGKP